VITRGNGHAISIGFALNGLTYVAGLIGFLSVVRYIGISFSIGFAMILCVAFYFDYRKRYAVSRKVLNSALAVFVALNFLRISLDNFAAPLVETILILMAIKFLEEKEVRDYMQIYVLATFLLAGSALLSLDLQFLVNFSLLALLLPLCIVLLTFHAQMGGMTLTDKQLMQVVSRALLIPLFSIPVTVLMFAGLPRTGYPLLNFLNARGSTAGFTDHVTLGDISGIQENSSVILRVETSPIDPQMLYWRGIVMDYFDGKTWRGVGRSEFNEGAFRMEGRRVAQTIYLEPYGNKYLFALDRPVSLYYRDVRVSGDFTMNSGRDIDSRIRYNAVSVLSGYDGLMSVDRKNYLQLPASGLESVRLLAEKLTAGRSDEAAALSILHYLRDGRFRYSLSDLPVTSSPIEDFLLTYRTGNCEYFASSMAVMLRMTGTPARMVGGYRGGVYNPLGGYYLITQNNAHVWVEVYINKKGWVRMDPTPAAVGIAPGGQPGLALKLRLMLDAMNYFWNSVVISYDLNRQVSLIAELKNAVRAPHVDMSAITGSAVLLTLVVISLAAIVIGNLRYAKRRSTEARIIRRFAKIMKKHGYERGATEGLQEFAARIENPSLREKVTVFASEFEGVYYRDKAMTKSDQAGLMRMLDDI